MSASLTPLFKTLGDSERAFQRLLLRRGSPQDLGVIRDMLRCCESVKQVIQGTPADLCFNLDSFNGSGNPILQQFVKQLDDVSSSSLLSSLSSALTESLPFSLAEGGFIVQGYSAELDEWRALAQNDTELLKKLQEEYISKTGVSRLKVKWTDALGFHVEVPASTPLNDSGTFFPCQMLKSHIRYKTNELTTLDSRRFHAADRVKSFELQIFESLKEQIEKEGLLISRCNTCLSILDVNCGLEKVCRQNGYIRPQVDECKRM